MPSDRYEQQRLRFKPEPVRILFVGESRPAGGKFFYTADSLLYVATKDAFYRAARDLLVEQNFLRSFAALGCYLDDLCPTPVNNLPPSEKEEVRKAGVEPLAERISEYGPEVVIIVLVSIDAHVREALDRAAVAPTVVATLPFPTRRYRNTYIQELTDLLLALRQRGFLAPPAS